MAVIELDRDAPPATAPSRPPARLLRPLGLALAAVLGFALGGAVPAAPVRWRLVGSIALADPDAAFRLHGNRIYTAAEDSTGQRVTAAWNAGSLTHLWTRRLDSGPSRAGVVSSRPTLTVAGGGLLLTGPTYATAMLDADTGTVRWTAPAPVQPVGSGVGVGQATHFRPGTAYDQASGEPGELFWSVDGQPHTEPPQRTTVYGVDLRTGRQLWAADERGSVRTLPVPGDAPAVLVAAADRLTVRDARSGQIRNQTAFPWPSGASWMEEAGDLVLVRRGTWGEGGTVAAYATATLQPLWQLSDPMDDRPGGYCYGLPCVKDGQGLVVLDPHTGRSRWRVPPGADLIAWGGELLETSERRVIGVRDPATGAQRSLPGEWNLDFAEPGRPALLRRAAADRTTFARLRAGRVQPLGSGPPGADECAMSERFVACRTGDDLAVWAYGA